MCCKKEKFSWSFLWSFLFHSAVSISNWLNYLEAHLSSIEPSGFHFPLLSLSVWLIDMTGSRSCSPYIRSSFWCDLASARSVIHNCIRYVRPWCRQKLEQGRPLSLYIITPFFSLSFFSLQRFRFALTALTIPPYDFLNARLFPLIIFSIN